MGERTSPVILQDFDARLAMLIAESRDIDIREAFELFIKSKTHELLEDDELKLWYFSPLVIFDMWENEIATGDPRNSLYLRGDEIA